jgi:MFS superfamily sulfate permease-like transporter
VSEEAAPAWHVADWGPLGWTETVLKTVGAGVGVAALLTALDRPADGASGARLVEVVLLGVLCVALLAGIADRFAQREVVGMVFILVMNAGHLAMAVALGRDPDVGGYLIAFCALMLAGDLVKLAFLARSGFTVRSVPRAAVFGLTGAFALVYAALIVIELAA